MDHAKSSRWLTIEDLHKCCCGGHRGYRNKMFFRNSESPCLPNASHQSLAQSDLFTIGEQVRFKNFQDGYLGGHLRYRTKTVSAILNLYATPMPPIKFGFNPHYGGRGDVV